MALTIEDGTGVAGADSWLDVAGITAYLAAHYTTAQMAAWTAGSSGDKEIWARQAAQFLSATFGHRFPGYRTNEDQGLPFPRTGAWDADGYAIEDDAIPQAILDAQCELALRAASGRLDADVTTSLGNISSESKSISGISKSVSYGPGGKPTEQEFPIVERILGYLIGVGGGQIVRG